MELYLGKTHIDWIKDFGGRMDKLPVGSEEYTKCQKIFAWLCHQVRIQDKANIEAQKNGNIN